MMNIQIIEEMIKKEFNVSLIEKDNYYKTSNDVIYVKEYRDGFHISLTKKHRKSDTELVVHGFNIYNEQDLKTILKKFKKLRKLF